MVQRAKRLQILKVMVLSWLLGSRIMTSAQAAERTVNIGFAGPISGLSASAGKSMLNAARMAVDDLNHAAVNVNGDKLNFVLLVQDDRSNPQIAELAAGYFIRRKVVGVVGIFNSAVALNSSIMYQRAGIAHFAVSGSRKFTRQGHDSAFRLAGYDEQRANVLAAFAVNELGKNRIAILYADSLYGSSYREKYANTLARLGARVVSSEAVSATTFDFNGALVNAKAAHPDVVFFAGLGDQSAMLARAMRRLGIKVPLVTSASIANANYLNVAGVSAEDTVAIMPGLHQNKSASLQHFEKEYLQRYNSQAGAYAASVYDQVRVLGAAIMQAGTTNPADIVNALHTIRHQGLSGNIAFDANGDLRELAFSMYQVQHGSWVLLKQYHFGADATSRLDH